MGRPSVAALLAVLALFQTLTTPAVAQTAGEFHAQVLDSTRAPIAGAWVTATPSGPGAPLTAVTDAGGQFRLALAPVTYTIAIESAGFLGASQQVNGARPGEAPRQFVLQVAGFAETVNVNAAGGYKVPATTGATRTETPLRDVPQSITVVTTALMQRPVDDERRGRGPVRAGHHDAPGRKQPRPDHDPRQQLLGRLLRQRRAR